MSYFIQLQILGDCITLVINTGKVKLILRRYTVEDRC